jgi:glutamate synthase domain-containing protein 2/glutamate synthase domain-containing protein 1/glutamate synthase domain-containing protein 3
MMNHKKTLEKQGLYDPRFEHESCGVGVVASIKGAKSHSIVEQGLDVLVSLAHRGACGCDPETGDGAGVLVQMPHELMQKHASKLGITLPGIGEYAVGMVFLPRDSAQGLACQETLERAITETGQTVLGWGDVPVNNALIGEGARSVEPKIRQVFIARGPIVKDEADFERRLYIARRLAENRVAASGMEDTDTFYISSLSSNRIVYKGLLMGTQVADFYTDLADPAMTSSFALVHARFSTNTLGSWKLAHPYRFMLHNGEINTLRGNINWMVARQALFASPLFGEDMNKLLPIITPGGSDSSAFDNALEVLLATGRSLPHAMMMMIPEAWNNYPEMPEEQRDFYEYHSSLMEPWDGPALIAATDGHRVCATLDRNGLRPFRYTVTKDERVIMASETGVLDISPDNILYKGRLQPGRMFLVDPSQGRIVDDNEIKSSLAHRRPYGQWLKENKVRLQELPEPPERKTSNFATLLQRQQAFGYTAEDLRILLTPMATAGQEPIGSMGNDIPLAVLSERPQMMFNYFKQLFAQVTNPPLDAIREELVTSLEGSVGAEQNLFEETPEHCQQLGLPRPILTNRELDQIRHITKGKLKVATISTLFSTTKGLGEMERALMLVCEQAAQAVRSDCNVLILSDREVTEENAAIPSLLATSAVHHHLIREGLRLSTGIVVESGEPREVMHFALLIGYGAAAINPYLAFETLEEQMENGMVPGINRVEEVQENFIKAIDKGILKVMSKMGISTIQGYRGAQIFEAIGLGQELVDRYFTWTPSRIGGIDVDDVEQEVLRLHKSAYLQRVSKNGEHSLDVGGVYEWRREGEDHLWNPSSIAALQHAVRTNNAESYSKFAEMINGSNRELSTLRGLMDFKFSEYPIPLEEVEPTVDIIGRFATGAISLGSISREAHETLALAMNGINARSNTGEGGEDYRRFSVGENGESRNSAVKQVASGRFGVTINYLSNATDLQIKMAQGSKPGEGGQLPGHKVDDYIGWIRHTTPGVELISPPPHHDIYSIEDLAQLIHDLKNANSKARIHVKLVSEVGVGTIAAGVSKAHADVVLISGDSGGTGASPESSVKHAGTAWELGVAETQQVLVMNDLRGRIVVQADGGLKTGRDVAIACLLGAEEFGFATAPLVSLGCIMLRKCHLNTCSVGIATQNPELRERFAGQPGHVINYFSFVAEELRQIMAFLGFRTINEMVGRMDKLEMRPTIDHWKAKGLDLSLVLHMPEVPKSVATYHCQTQDHGLQGALDHQLIALSKDALEKKKPVEIRLPIRNANRTVGTMLSGEIANRYGEEGLPDGTIQVYLDGSAGQSFGAFLAKGLSMTVEGDANDYFCKGLSGGSVAIYPPRAATFISEENIIVGNVSLYGATDGKAFIRGQAGERFAVRNSGAQAVVEGIGDHGCEYMTGGVVVVLGRTGRNFAAGMSGGLAFVLDEDGDFDQYCNTDMVDLEPVTIIEDRDTLHQLVEEHFEKTKSPVASRILDSWPDKLSQFVKVMPRDYRRVLEALQHNDMEEVNVDG